MFLRTTSVTVTANNCSFIEGRGRSISVCQTSTGVFEGMDSDGPALYYQLGAEHALA